MQKSSPVDLVTETDQKVEALIISSIREKYPSHRWLKAELSLNITYNITYPSIHPSNNLSCSGMGVPIPGSMGPRMRVIPDGVPLHHRAASHTHSHSPSHTMGQQEDSLAGGRRTPWEEDSEYPGSLRQQCFDCFLIAFCLSAAYYIYRLINYTHSHSLQLYWGGVCSHRVIQHSYGKSHMDHRPHRWNH